MEITKHEMGVLMKREQYTSCTYQTIKLSSDNVEHAEQFTIKISDVLDILYRLNSVNRDLFLRLYLLFIKI